jgi:hypothetical protein
MIFPVCRHFTATFYLLFLVPVFICVLKAEAKTGQKNLNFPKIRRETIRVNGLDKGFTSNVVVQSVAVKDHPRFFINYSSFESVRIISVKYHSGKKGKLKKFPSFKVIDYQTPTDEFYSSQRTKQFLLPESDPFEVEYERKFSDIMLFSRLSTYSPYDIDTFYYSIFVPHKLHFCYRFDNPELLNYLKVDSNINAEHTNYKIACVLKTQQGKVQEDEDNPVRVRRFGIRTIITPVEYKGNEAGYFNKWILGKTGTGQHAGKAAGYLADSLTKGMKSRDSIARALFDFVRTQIRYINVEIGYGAFIPKDDDSILEIKQGDCKDKSSLLSHLLIAKGIDARLAMTSTAGYFTEMDFPSLSSGNHMICAVSRPEGWMFLDPTEEFSLYGHSGEMTQGRMAFILDSNGGRFERITPFTPAENRERFCFNIRLGNDSIYGSFTFSFKGIMMIQIRRALSGVHSGEWLNFAKGYVSSWTKNIFYDHVIMLDRPDSISFSGNIRLPDHILLINDTLRYLSLDFMPQPLMEFAKENISAGDIFLIHKIDKEVIVSVEPLFPYRNYSLKPARYDDTPYDFSMESGSSGKHILIGYNFTFNDVMIRKEDNSGYQKFAGFISKTFNNALKIW